MARIHWTLVIRDSGVSLRFNGDLLSHLKCFQLLLTAHTAYNLDRRCAAAALQRNPC